MDCFTYIYHGLKGKQWNCDVPPHPIDPGHLHPPTPDKLLQPVCAPQAGDGGRLGIFFLGGGGFHLFFPLTASLSARGTGAAPQANTLLPRWWPLSEVASPLPASTAHRLWHQLKASQLSICWKSRSSNDQEKSRAIEKKKKEKQTAMEISVLSVSDSGRKTRFGPQDGCSLFYTRWVEVLRFSFSFLVPFSLKGGGVWMGSSQEKSRCGRQSTGPDVAPQTSPATPRPRLINTKWLLKVNVL